MVFNLIAHFWTYQQIRTNDSTIEFKKHHGWKVDILSISYTFFYMHFFQILTCCPRDNFQSTGKMRFSQVQWDQLVPSYSPVRKQRWPHRLISPELHQGGDPWVEWNIKKAPSSWKCTPSNAGQQILSTLGPFRSSSSEHTSDIGDRSWITKELHDFDLWRHLWYGGSVVHIHMCAYYSNNTRRGNALVSLCLVLTTNISYCPYLVTPSCPCFRHTIICYLKKNQFL